MLVSDNICGLVRTTMNHHNSFSVIGKENHNGFLSSDYRSLYPITDFVNFGIFMMYE